jgi:hypothetical protein
MCKNCERKPHYETKKRDCHGLCDNGYSVSPVHTRRHKVEHSDCFDSSIFIKKCDIEAYIQSLLTNKCDRVECSCHEVKRKPRCGKCEKVECICRVVRPRCGKCDKYECICRVVRPRCGKCDKVECVCRVRSDRCKRCEKVVCICKIDKCGKCSRIACVCKKK